MKKQFSSTIFRIVKIGLIAIGGAIAIYLFWVPYVPDLNKDNPTTTSLIELRKKQAAKKNRKFVPQFFWKKLNEISPDLIQAVILAEDDTFYQHKGFDFEQIKIAIKINWKKKRFAYGGSTITQQLARTLYLSPKKSLLRKAKEAIITFWMERLLSKKRILEIYLNVVEWGDGIFGAEAAARHYYKKNCAELTPEEAVALASILPSPRKWSPHRETPFMKYRRDNILSRMQEAAQTDSAKQSPEQEKIADEIAADEEKSNEN